MAFFVWLGWKHWKVTRARAICAKHIVVKVKKMVKQCKGLIAYEDVRWTIINDIVGENDSADSMTSGNWGPLKKAGFDRINTKQFVNLLWPLVLKEMAEDPLFGTNTIEFKGRCWRYKGIQNE
jgi:hypothetical protein